MKKIIWIFLLCVNMSAYCRQTTVSIDDSDTIYPSQVEGRISTIETNVTLRQTAGQVDSAITLALNEFAYQSPTSGVSAIVVTNMIKELAVLDSGSGDDIVISADGSISLVSVGLTINGTDIETELASKLDKSGGSGSAD